MCFDDECKPGSAATTIEGYSKAASQEQLMKTIRETADIVMTLWLEGDNQ